MIRIDSAPGTGRGRIKTEWTMAKMAVLAPIQSARVSATVIEKPRSFKSDRIPNLISRKSARMECYSLIRTITNQVRKNVGRQDWLPHFTISLHYHDSLVSAGAL